MYMHMYIKLTCTCIWTIVSNFWDMLLKKLRVYYFEVEVDVCF